MSCNFIKNAQYLNNDMINLGIYPSLGSTALVNLNLNMLDSSCSKISKISKNQPASQLCLCTVYSTTAHHGHKNLSFIACAFYLRSLKKTLLRGGGREYVKPQYTNSLSDSACNKSGYGGLLSEKFHPAAQTNYVTVLSRLESLTPKT